MRCSEREKATRKGGSGRERERAGSVVFSSAAATGVHLLLGSCRLKAKRKSEEEQVINALSVFLPMFRRSGTSQEEPKAGGEYSRTSALLCVHVSPAGTSHLILLLPFFLFLSRILPLLPSSLLLYAFLASVSSVSSPHSCCAGVLWAIKNSHAPQE